MRQSLTLLVGVLVENNEMEAPTKNTGRVAAENIGNVAIPEDDTVIEPIDEIAIAMYQSTNATHAENNACKHAYLLNNTIAYQPILNNVPQPTQSYTHRPILHT